jgi:protein SCO1/2
VPGRDSIVIINRNSGLFTVLVAALLVVATAGVLVARTASSGDGGYRGSAPPGSETLPSFELRDYSGKLVRAAEIRGNALAVTFLESKCREACPLIASQIGQALALLDEWERRRVTALAISTHPEDDTPASVRRFLRNHRVEGRLLYLIGSERELRPVWTDFHVLPALDSGDAETHSAPVRIFDRSGEWVSTLHPGVDLTPANLAHDLRVAMEQ